MTDKDDPETSSQDAPEEDSREDDGQGLADEFEQQADELEHRGEKLEQQADEVREDWERKRADRGVPGAPPDHDGD